MEVRKQEVKTYLQNVVNPILKPIVEAIVKAQPPNILKFIHTFVEKELKLDKHANIQDLKEATQQSLQQVLTNQQQEEMAKRMAKKKQAGQKTNNRKGISAEVFGEFNKKSHFEPRIIKKSDQTNKFIKGLFEHSIMFYSLNQENTKIVVNAMQERNVVVNQQIITEGEDGDMLYLIGSGQFECTKLINGSKTYLKTYTAGDLFGEHSLMYNAKRAASIKCTKADRQTFTNIIQESAIKRRKQYMKIISEIEILSDVQDKERQQLCDAFKQELFEANKYVVKEGENGDRFYFIVEGNLVAEKHNPKTGKSQIVFKYKDREFFGEIALIKNTVRQASIKTVTKCKIISIGRDEFRRLLGPIENILQRNSLKYKKFISN